MEERTCRTCRHWDAPASGYPRCPEHPVSDVAKIDAPCTMLLARLDVNLEQRGWDGYSTVESIWTTAEWFCGWWEKEEE